MPNCNCQTICSDDPAAEMNCLYRLFDRINECETYKVATNLSELVKDCLNTAVGQNSTDNIVYRRGRGLVIKIQDDVSILYTTVGEVIIDDLNMILDLPNIDGCDISEDIPRLSLEFLNELAQKLTTCPAPPITPGPTPVPPSEPEPTEEFPIVENP